MRNKEMKARKNKAVDVSQNVAWTLQRGSWMIHILVLVLIRVTFSIFLNSDISWQLSLIIYNLMTLVFFHLISGDPFNDEYANYTFWEQLSLQLEDSSGLVFISIFPLLSFMIISYFTKWSTIMLWLCGISLFLVTLPKLGFMHLRRLFLVLN
jgi:hypothetical protein